MANYLRENPFFIDTAPVNIGPPEFGRIFVKEVRWESFVPEDVLIVETGTGGTLINETVGAADTDLQVMRFGPFGWVNGFNVIQLKGDATSSTPNLVVTITKS